MVVAISLGDAAELLEIVDRCVERGAETSLVGVVSATVGSSDCGLIAASAGVGITGVDVLSGVSSDFGVGNFAAIGIGVGRTAKGVADATGTGVGVGRSGIGFGIGVGSIADGFGVGVGSTLADGCGVGVGATDALGSGVGVASAVGDGRCRMIGVVGGSGADLFILSLR